MKNKRISGITFLDINCPRCGEKQITLVKVSINELGEEVVTLNKTRVCQNKNCSVYVCLSGVRGWKELR